MGLGMIVSVPRRAKGRALRLLASLKERLLVELGDRAPQALGGAPVARTVALDTGDGYKFWVDDGSWLLVRFSGTEPLVRVYAEASNEALRDALLAEGGAMVTGA